MNTVKGWIRRNQVAAFFILTFAITWSLGFPIVRLSIRRTSCWLPSSSSPRPGRRWRGFWLLPVAFVIRMAHSHLPAVKRYLSSLTDLSGSWRWHILALVLIPTWILLSVVISSALGRNRLWMHHFPTVGLPLIGLIVVKFLYQLFFFNATGEEAGWRGFALPRMQAVLSPLSASLVLNLFWPLWHLFLWKAEGRSVFSLAYWGQTYLELLPATVALIMIFNRSKGSILSAGIAMRRQTRLLPSSQTWTGWFLSGFRRLLHW